jgi:serine/threonine protein kinase
MNNNLLWKMLIGQVINNQYHLKDLIGAGGYGGVFRADEVIRDKLIRQVAIKLIIADNNNDGQLDEIIAATDLQHPNLIRCFSGGESSLNGADFLYLVMEVADFSLEKRLTQGVLSETETTLLVQDIAEALVYLHNQPKAIVHRDLKPGNVLRVGDKWKLSDFGLVKVIGKDNVVDTINLMGTAGYAPPEAYQGKVATAWDVWSLGIIIVEALTGKSPFPGNTPQQLQQQICNQEPNLSGLPQKFEPIVKGCLVKDWTKRWTAKRVLDSLSGKTKQKSEPNKIFLRVFQNHPEDYGFREDKIAEELIARNLSQLFELLINFKGVCLNQKYTLRWLYAVGGQSIVYLAENYIQQMVIVKIAFLPYHRAAYISNDDIRKARKRLKEEARLLQRFSNTTLPNFYELIEAPNPLHSPARGAEFAKQEPYLVMEFIQGRNLLEITRQIHRTSQPDYKALELLVWETAMMVTNFCISIAGQAEAYLYSDLNPFNLIFCDDLNNPVRILDAGSLIPFFSDKSIFPPFTEAYLPPEYYEANEKGGSLYPTPTYVMYTLGKTLWEILTNRQPYPAEEPNMSEPIFKNYSRQIKDLISNLVSRQYLSFEQMKEAIESLHISREISTA